jgi:two-component system, OmpR family, response regulator
LPEVLLMSVPPLKKILYVEDEPLVQALARAALEKRGGFTVLACASGAAAVEAAPSFAPDLLLLDVMMPGLDGPATLAALRRLPATSTTPAMFMTTKAQGQALAASSLASIIGMIEKPFDPKTLAEAVGALWARGHGANAADGAR